jgi:hypothetical protein
VIFLLCDDVRPEIGNKLTLLGLYGTDILLSSNAPLTLPSIVFAFLIRDGEGTFQGRLRVLRPNGEPFFEAPEPHSVTIIPGTSVTEVSKFVPFPVEIGTYTVEFFLDQHRYVRNFRAKRIST